MSTCSTCKHWKPPQWSYPMGTCHLMGMDSYLRGGASLIDQGRNFGKGVLTDTPATKRRRRKRKIDFMISWPSEEGPPLKALHLVVYTKAEFGCTEYVASKRRRPPPAPEPVGTPRRYLHLLED